LNKWRDHILFQISFVKNCIVKNSLIRFVRDRWLIIKYFLLASHTITTKKRINWSLWKITQDILTELGRSMTQEKCTKIVSMKMSRQSHQTVNRTSSSSKIALSNLIEHYEFDWRASLIYINERVVHACIRASWCPCTQTYCILHMYYLRPHLRSVAHSFS